jgi:hypothetical protein
MRGGTDGDLRRTASAIFAPEIAIRRVRRCTAQESRGDERPRIVDGKIC